MRIIVSVDQAAAIRAGKNRSGNVVIDIDPAALTQGQRDEMALHISVQSEAALALGIDSRELSEKGGCVHLRQGSYADSPKFSPVAEATPETVAGILNDLIVSRHKIEADEKAKKEKVAKKRADEIATWLALPDDGCVEKYRPVNGWRLRYFEHASAPECADKKARLSKLCDDRDAADAEAKKKSDAEAAERQRIRADQEVAQQQRNREALTAVVARLGTDLQRQKWAVGVMAHSEALDLLFNETFPDYSATGAGPLKNTWHVETERTDEWGTDIVDDYDESDKKTLTDEEFVVAAEITAKVPDAKAEYFKQRSYTDDKETVDSCVLLRLSKKVEGFDLEADYILSSVGMDD